MSKVTEEKVTLPKELRLKKDQNVECNKKGCLCGLFNNQNVCLRLLLEKGEFSGFELEKCEKEKDRRIKVSL